MDNKKFYKLMSLSWVEPQYFLGKNDYIFDNILPDILNKFEQINIAKVPKEKIKLH